ncbi:ATP synthase F1 subunit epsilon [Spiroplasma endosymbiont of Amphibalanus improvisus]|uniref:ATP synthase F1 subunit epsilon n=1 Tax=Spiroplasma endosymbiont of Amphibalanus improvisus TaxID=3066327 RepID=UPI00313D56A6
MANQIKLKIITPDGIICDKLVDIVIVRTINGYLGILHGHIPLVSTIIPSKLKYKINEKEEVYDIQGGILQTTQDTVKILADSIILDKERSIKMQRQIKRKID